MCWGGACNEKQKAVTMTMPPALLQDPYQILVHAWWPGNCNRSWAPSAATVMSLWRTSFEGEVPLLIWEFEPMNLQQKDWLQAASWGQHSKITGCLTSPHLWRFIYTKLVAVFAAGTLYNICTGVLITFILLLHKLWKIVLLISRATQGVTTPRNQDLTTRERY